ncbi:hypothetical protein [Campylobacter jejuni]|uniref:hypothetical protein n=1 Tax=Campylobacter jejuni TaxID=197 RepID=UPI000F800965|nr:hypothetical protein [Campylobacter jejuni]RTH72587.1 hypothetical protein C3I43_08735 [Campylobacter jejuni]
MLVSKTTLSYLNDTNLKEHILYAIQNKAVLAIINRDFTEDDDGNRIDDIIPEEIQAGTQAIKEYCLENNELELLKQYLPLVLQDEALLNEIKDIMFVEIKLKAEKLSHELLVDEVPNSEVATFNTQRSEAIAYRNSGYTNDNLCPMLKIIAEIRAMPLRDLVDKCLLKSSLYETEIAKILGKRQKLEDAIKKAQTLEELNLIVW